MGAIEKVAGQPLFELQRTATIKTPCLLKIEDDHHEFEIVDPYTFTNSISQDDLHLFGEGNLKQAYKMLGAQSIEQQGVAGVRFATWAPNAERVSVVGSFNDWDAGYMRCALLVVVACGRFSFHI